MHWYRTVHQIIFEHFFRQNVIPSFFMFTKKERNKTRENGSREGENAFPLEFRKNKITRDTVKNLRLA